MGFVDKADEVHLKPWLIRTLEPICDADPTVLSDYVLALLRHDEPESQLREGVQKQLSDFLESEAPPFVDKLFRSLRTKSFLPYDDGKPSPISTWDGGPPTGPRGTKRGADDDFSGANRQPPKGPRLNGDSTRGGPPSRFNDARGGARGGFGGRGGPPPAGPRDRSSEPCRDYHNKGFCSRGETCPYTHDEGAIVPPMPMPGPGGPYGMAMPMNPMQMMAMMQGMPWMMDGAANGGGGAYNPNDAHMDMSGTPFNGNRNMNGNANGRRRDGRGPAFPTDAVQLSSSLPPNPTILDPSSSTSSTPAPGISPFNPPNNGPNGHAPANGARGRGSRGRGRGGPRGGGPSERSAPGTFPLAEDHPSFPESDAPAESSSSNPSAARPSKNSNTTKTIVVEKIPPEKLTLPAVSEYFSKFGSVTNVAVDIRTAKALVSFATPDEARAAWKSEDAVFGNRFVKVFWHRPLPGHGEAAMKKLAASAPLVQNIVSDPSPSTSTPLTAPSSSTSAAKPPVPSMTPAESIAARKQLLDKQIAEQKSLFASLDGASADEKKEIMAKLRKLGEEIKVSSSSSSTAARKPPNEASSSATNGAATPSSESVTGDSTKQSELLAELALLQKQAAEVGVPSNVISGTYRGRGRGRGRGTTYPPPRGGAFARGRGAAAGAGAGGPVRSMKLDNRPKVLLVKGVDSSDGNAVFGVEEFYKNVGNVDIVHTSNGDDIHVTFPTRAAAEQSLSKGVPPGSTSVSWYTPTPTAPSALPKASSATPKPEESEFQSSTAGIPDEDSKMAPPTAGPGTDVDAEADVVVEDGGWTAGEGFDDL